MSESSRYGGGAKLDWVCLVETRDGLVVKDVVTY